MKLDIINAALPTETDGPLHRLKAEHGRWTAIHKQDSRPMEEGYVSPENGVRSMDDCETLKLDLQGRILLPGMADGHVHLDKAHTIETIGNEQGTLMGAIENYRSHAPLFTKEAIKERMRKTVQQAALHGTTAMRSHLDFFTADDGTVARRTVEAALEIREEMRDIMTLQFYLMCDPATLPEAHEATLSDCLQAGLDGIGGAPHLSPDHHKAVEALFDWSEKEAKPLDLHSDETDDPGVNTVSLIAEETIRRGMKGQVTVGHLCSLSAMAQSDADQTMDRISQAGLHVMTLPGANMYLQGRDDQGLIRRGVTRVKELHDLGVNVSVASDNIQDPFHPFGKGDLLEIGRLSTYAAHMNSEQERLTTLRMLSAHPARAMGLHKDGYGFQRGAPATCVITGQTSVTALFAELSPARIVIRNGRVQSMVEQQQQWFSPETAYTRNEREPVNLSEGVMKE